MNTGYEFHDIEDYLTGRMSPADRSAFEAAMASDPDLALQVEALRVEPHILRLLQKEMLRQRLYNWQAAAKKRRRSTTRILRNLLWLTAAAVALALLYWRSGSVGSGNKAPHPTVQQAPTGIDSTPLTPPAAAPVFPVPPDTVKRNPNPTVRVPKERIARIEFIVDSLGLITKPRRSYIAGPSGTDSLLNLAWEKFEQSDPAALPLLQQLDSVHLDALRMRAYLLYAQGNNGAAAKLFARLSTHSNILYHVTAERAEIACYLHMLPSSYPVLDSLLHNMAENPQISENRKALARFLLDEIAWAKPGRN